MNKKLNAFLIKSMTIYALSLSLCGCQKELNERTKDEIAAIDLDAKKKEAEAVAEFKKNKIEQEKKNRKAEPYVRNRIEQIKMKLIEQCCDGGQYVDFEILDVNWEGGKDYIAKVKFKWSGQNNLMNDYWLKTKITFTKKENSKFIWKYEQYEASESFKAYQVAKKLVEVDEEDEENKTDEKE